MNVGPARLAIAAVLALAAGEAAAETIQVGNDTWTHERLERGEQFSRPDGTIIELGASALRCGTQLRAVPARRFAWLPVAFWPWLDTGGGFLSLCLDRVDGTVIVTVKPPPGQAAGDDLAAMLRLLAEQVRPPTMIEGLGTLHASSPVAAVRGERVTFLVEGKTAELVVLVRPQGTCPAQHAQVLARTGQVVPSVAFADGYWPTVFEASGQVHGCLELREGYVSVAVRSGTPLEELGDVLAELRRAAHATHGAPITSEVDPLILPRTGQRVAGAGGTGAWKVVAGERFGLPGADVLLSILPLGGGSTLFALGLAEGRCAPGPTAAPPDVAAAVFPPQLGAVWVDPDRRRWRASACLGTAATLTVMGPVDIDQPPTATEAHMLRALVTRVARSYGLDVPDVVDGATAPPPRRRADAVVVAAGYAGLLSLDGHRGGLAGLNLRVDHAGELGVAYAVGLELGFVAGGLVGEARAAVGFAGRLGPVVLDVVAGAGTSSLGAAALVDVYAEASLGVPLAGARTWIGLMHGSGIDGPDLDRVELRVAVPRGGGRGVFLGARYTELAGGAGDALLVTIGGGVVGTD